MKINSISQQIHIGKYTRNIRMQDVQEITQGKDKVELSDSAVSFAAAMKNAGATNITRSISELNEMQEIKQQIKDGTFDVSGKDIADKMLKGMVIDIDA